MVVAWRINRLMRLGRELPDLPADLLFDVDEWKAAFILNRRKQPKDVPTLNTVASWAPRTTASPAPRHLAGPARDRRLCAGRQVRRAAGDLCVMSPALCNKANQSLRVGLASRKMTFKGGENEKF